MKGFSCRLLLVIGLACFGSAATAQQLSDPGDPAEQRTTVALASSFLHLIDQGKTAESWAKTGPILHGMTTQEKWDETLKGIRRDTGPLKSRELLAARFTEQIEGAPNGHYFVVFYTSHFAKLTAEEKVIYSRSGKTWKVEGYFITPAETKP